MSTSRNNRDDLIRYVDACRQAVANDPADNRAKVTLSSALFDANRRTDAIVPLREAAATGDADKAAVRAAPEKSKSEGRR